METKPIRTIASLKDKACNADTLNCILNCLSEFTGPLDSNAVYEYLSDNRYECMEQQEFIEVYANKQTFKIYINDFFSYIVVMAYSETLHAIAVMSNECSCQSLTELMDFSENNKPIPEFHNIEADAIAHALRFSDTDLLSDYEIDFIESCI